MDIHAPIGTAPGIHGGQPVIAGTQVPTETPFGHLEMGVSLDNFSTVCQALALALLGTTTVGV